MIGRRIFPAIVILAVASCIAGFVLDSGMMLRSYLYAWLFVLGLSLGALANLMVHALSGGHWGEAIRAPLRAAAATIGVVAVLFVPLLAGFGQIYPWAASAAAVGEQPAIWLNPIFFAVRSVAYLGTWCVFAWLWLRGDRPSPERDATVAPLSAAGLIVYAFTVSLAAFDWIISLTHGWYSTSFGFVLGAGQMLSAMAFGVLAAAFMTRPGAQGQALRQRFHDLGNLLLMYVLVWTYLVFTQFLIIWAENLPKEIIWYLPRTQTSWHFLGLFVLVFHFFVPLAILLFRAAKRSPILLGSLAGILLVAHLADVFWLVMPTFRPDGFALRWTDLAALVGVGGVWLIGWGWAMRTHGRFAVARRVRG